MPGRVLIVDDLATNRIILKVRLGAAYYDVSQAGGIAEARRLIESSHPDLILLGARGGGDERAAADLGQRVAQLCSDPLGGPAAPVIVLLDHTARADRAAALRAGAADVMSRPLDEGLLLARLRSLMRQRLTDRDLHHHCLTAQAGGFAERPGAFDPPGEVAVIAQQKAEARKLQVRLAANTRHGLRMMSAQEIMCPGLRAASAAPARPRPPDAFVMQLETAPAEDGPRLLSELRADPETRGCPVIAHLPAGQWALAAQLHDLGAGDVVFSNTDPEEIALRLDRQLADKRRLDGLRDRLQDGLQAAVTDPLTGLYNRRYALSYLDNLLIPGPAGAEGFAVMVADLDHFKLVNDRLGHTAGDTVLCHVAQRLKAGLRRDDLIARIGGEEFLIIVPGTTQEAAHRIAIDLCGRVGDTPFALPGPTGPTRVTISIGLALAHQGGTPASDIIEQADRALYRSKAEGRNTVRFATRDAA